jgi:PAS domain S-box-containing protein
MEETVPFKQAHQRYQDIFSNLPLGVILLNQSGQIRFANPAAGRLLGPIFQPGVENSSLADLWQAIQVDGSSIPYQEFPGMVALRTGQQLFNQRLGIYNYEKQSYVWVNVSATPLFEPGASKVLEVLVTFEDQTTQLQTAEQAQRATSILEKTFASLKDAVFVQEYPGWKILSFNKAAEEMFGYSAPEMGGQSMGILHVNPSMFEHFGQMSGPFLERRGVFYCEYLMRCKDGSLMITENTVSSIVDPQGGFQGWVSVVRDITARKRAEYQISQYAMQLKTLTTLSQRLDEIEFDPPAILDMVSRLMARVVGDACAIYLNSEDGTCLIPAAMHHIRPDIDAGLDWCRSQVLKVGTGAMGQAVRSRQPILLPVVNADAAAAAMLFEPENRWIAEKMGVKSLISVPLRTPLAVIGTLLMVRDQPDWPYSANDQTFLQEVADRTGLSIQNARMVEATRLQSRELRELAGRLSALEEAERRALARELHDQVSQYLTALSIDLEIIQSQLPPGAPPLAGERVQDALEITSQTSARIRDVMADLRPAVLDDYGLEAALRWLAARFTRQSGLLVRVAWVVLNPRVPL